MVYFVGGFGHRVVRSGLAVMLGCILWAGIPGSGHAEAPTKEAATNFVETLAAAAVRSLTDPKRPIADRITDFRKLFRERFAVAVIARWVLGRRAWKKASQAERKEYLDLFEDLMVSSYVNRFTGLQGDAIKIKRAVPLGRHVVEVQSAIVRTEGASAKPVRVGWRIGANKGANKVVDVVVEGVSMSQTLRGEFSSVMKQKGGLPGLLAELRTKTEGLKE